MESKPATGSCAVRANDAVGLALQDTEYWKMLRASNGASYWAPLSMVPTKKLGLPAGGGLLPSRSEGSRPSPGRYGVFPGVSRNFTIRAPGLPSSILWRSSAYAPMPAKESSGANSRAERKYASGQTPYLGESGKFTPEENAYRKYAPVGSGVAETATQLKKTGPAAVNCVRIHRSAIWSYSTTGSPALPAQSGTSKPCHSVPSRSGPSSRVPVFEYTANTRFTIST